MAFKLFSFKIYIPLLILAITVLVPGQYLGNFGQCFAKNFAESKEQIPKGLEYQLKKDNNHIIHVLAIDPSQYRLELVKGHNQVFGRETVAAMSARKNAVAAINGGFFEIGNNEDGRPSGTLIIKNNILALAQKERAILILEDNKVNIGKMETKINIQFYNTPNQKITPSKINQFLKKDEVGLYTPSFGPTTLTDFERREIIIDNNVITHITEHGDNAIPAAGMVLSFPKAYPISFAKVNDKTNLEIITYNISSKTQSKMPSNALMGIPIIVENGQAVDVKKLGSKAFAETPHARTAVGTKADGTIIFVVVEHVYTKPLDQLTVDEAKNILREKGYSQQKINETTLAQMLTIIQNNLSSSVGLSLPALAEFMVSLNCVQAINLDGGGSSTLLLNGKVMNSTVGDKDESLGEKTLRPVSDAIVVMRVH